MSFRSRGTRIARCVLFLLFFILPAQTVYAEIESGTGSLKIISLNVWFGLDGRGYLRVGEHESQQQRGKRYEGLLDGLRSYDPDVLFIQEANPLPSYARRLARDLGMREIHAVSNGGIRLGAIGVPTNLRMGTAILAKPELGLKKVGTYRTSGAGVVSNLLCFHLSEVRILLAGVVYPDDEPLYLFCLHAHASAPDTDEYRDRLNTILDAEGVEPDKRRHYIDSLASDVGRIEQDVLEGIPYIEGLTRGGKPFVVAGDFNAFPPVFPFMSEFVERLHLLDSYAAANPGRAGCTWDPSRNPNTKHDGALTWTGGEIKAPLDRLEAEYAGAVPQRIDYIFLSSQFAPEDVLSSKLVFTEPYEGVYVSDHFGVMTEVALK